MTITLDCPACGKIVRAADASAGKRGKCPDCGGVIVVPGGVEPEAVEQDFVDEEHVEERGDEPVRNAMPTVALVSAAGGAVLGAAAWAILMVVGSIELGWLAWGIGGLVGTAAAKAGGRGVVMAAASAVLALVGIFGGKYAAISHQIDTFEEESITDALNSPELRTVYRELESDSEAWGTFTEPPADLVLAQFMIDRRYTHAVDAELVAPEELARFRDEKAPLLEEFGATQPSFESWNAEKIEDIREFWASVSAIDAVRQDLNMVDLIFMALGVATAWGIVMRTGDSERRASRRMARSSRTRRR